MSVCPFDHKRAAGSGDTDATLVAMKAAGCSVFSTTNTRTYNYAGTGYANPDAVTQIGTGLSTTTYAYDNNGNLISSGNGTATTTYTYDYANRLIALFAGGATTTYGYDAFGAPVLQTGTTTRTRTCTGRRLTTNFPLGTGTRLCPAASRTRRN